MIDGNLFFCTKTWLAQVVTQILRPTDLVYDFSFPSYARFREGTRSMPQKVFPHPTVRAPSASNSPSALSARAGYHHPINLVKLFQSNKQLQQYVIFRGKYKTKQNIFSQDDLECKIPQLDLVFKWGRKVYDKVLFNLRPSRCSIS